MLFFPKIWKIFLEVAILSIKKNPSIRLYKLSINKTNIYVRFILNQSPRIGVGHRNEFRLALDQHTQSLLLKLLIIP